MIFSDPSTPTTNSPNFLVAVVIVVFVVSFDLHFLPSLHDSKRKTKQAAETKTKVA